MSNLKCKDAVVYSLIHEVKNHECVWNIEHDDYNDRSKTARAWMDIAMKIELPEDFLRAKWKNLRDTYKKELKKVVLKSQTSSGQCSKWQYFDAFGFFSSHCSKEPCQADQPDIVDAVETYFMPCDGQGNYILGEIHDKDPIPTESKRIKRDEERYDLMFLESLLPFIRELDPMRKLVFRSKIQELLMNEISKKSSNNTLERSCNTS